MTIVVFDGVRVNAARTERGNDYSVFGGVRVNAARTERGNDYSCVWWGKG